MMFRFLIFVVFLMAISPLKGQSHLIAQFQQDSYGGLSKTIAYDGKLYFTASDATHGRELWCTDGTPNGTKRIKDINTGSASGVDFYFSAVVANGILYFKANDGVNGWELWRTDGTSNGTYMVKDLNAGGGSSDVGYFAVLGNVFYFISNLSLWRSNGTAQGTYSLKSFNVLGHLYAFNGWVYFSADNNNQGQELWRSNGTTNGTQLFKDLNGVVGASLPINFHANGGLLYFMAMTSNSDWELWKTDGTNSGTQLIKDINPNGSSVLDFYSEAYIKSIGNEVYFRANGGTNGVQLWKSDGTATGTLQVSNLPNGIDYNSTFPILNGKILFASYNDPYFYEYDPTTNAVNLTHYPYKNYFNNLEKFTHLNGIQYFASQDSTYGAEIWQADGTPNGIKKIQETFLLNNWSYNNTQNFNNIIGVLNGDSLLFTLNRSVYSSNIALFTFLTSDTTTCFPPSIFANVPTSNTQLHIVWNEVENADQYQLRYRPSGTTTWTTLPADVPPYTVLSNLQAATNYHYQVRTDCGGGYWTAWSPIETYNASPANNNNGFYLLADRSEDSTTHRLYWLPNPQISNVQFRYCPYGTSTWTNTSNANGFKKITNLMPATFYEYQYRINSNGSWLNWSFGSLYFKTRSRQTVVNPPPPPIPDSVMVTFQVDMHQTSASNGVFLRADFDNFTGQTPLTDTDGDDIWSVSMLLPDSTTYNYRFLNANTPEQLDALDSCAVALGGAWYRTVTVAATDTTLAAPCFEACVMCMTPTTTADFSSLKIFPNPVQEVLYFENEPPLSFYFLTNIQGKIVQQGKIYDHKIDLKNIKNGWYYLVLKSKRGIVTTKLIQVFR